MPDYYNGSQTTLAETVMLSGIGVHCGEPVSITMGPADANTGIVFVRTNIPNSDDVEINATWKSVSATELCTVIGLPGKTNVATIEHLLAALFGLGIDNVIVEIDGPEVPVLDGSASGFVAAIDNAGTVRQDARRRYLRVREPVRVEFGDAYGELLPHDRFSIDVTIDFETPTIGRQRFAADMVPSKFRNELSRARTFGRVEDVEKLWAMGYALGSSLENSVALSGDKILNPEGVRWPDEFVRHKALDAVGDLALAGYPILGLYRSYKGGHKMNYHVVRALLENTDAWEIVVMEPAREVGRADIGGGIASPVYSPEIS